MDVSLLHAAEVFQLYTSELQCTKKAWKDFRYHYDGFVSLVQSGFRWARACIVVMCYIPRVVQILMQHAHSSFPSVTGFIKQFKRKVVAAASGPP